MFKIDQSQLLTEGLVLAMAAGAQMGRARRSLLPFTLWLRTCLKIERQHILHVLSYPSYYKYACAPLSKLPSCAPEWLDKSRTDIGSQSSSDEIQLLISQHLQNNSCNSKIKKNLTMQETKRFMIQKNFLV